MQARLLLLLSTTLLGCSTSFPFRRIPHSTDLAATEGSSLPVEWVGDWACIDVTIEGKAAGRFLLDTGASAAALAPATADALGLPRMAFQAEGGLTVRGSNDTSTTVEFGIPIREMRCGPLTVHDFDAVELDLRQLQRALGCPIAGVLPVTLFRDVVLTIDYVERRIAVREPSHDAPASPHTLQLESDSLPHVLLRVGDTDVPVLLDSGSGFFLTLPDVVKVPCRGPLVETGKAWTVGGDVPIHEVRLDTDLDWAGHTLALPIVDFTAESCGAVGTGLLRHFRVEIDQPNRRATFVRTSREALASQPVRSAGIGLTDDGPVWTILYLLDHTPAAQSGLRVGDQVTAIDGVEVRELSLAAYGQLLAERDVLSLVVRGQQGVHFVDVPVTVLVP